MQQFAALAELMAKHPEWAQKVVGLMVNQDVAVGGLESCGAASALPVLQDGVGAPMWTMLGGAYNSVILVDAQGIVVHKIDPVSYPDAASEIEGVVNALVQ